jgi:catecholate siderophore receptor
MKKAKTKLPVSFRAASLTPPPSMARTSLALGISTAMLMPLAALAAEPGKESATTLKAVKVQDKVIDPNPNAEPGVPYKARTSADQRHTRPLAETPQTIQVLTSEAIKDSGYTDLREILDAQPGITLGTGENGNAFGDRYIIRGQEARSDVFVDGLRDPGMTIRESFAVEQVEITKGPNSSFAGRGSAGGAINAVTKQATQDYNFAKLSTAFGSDKHTRLTLDVNQALTDTIAVRANALYGYEEVPDRDPTDRERKGFALSGLFTPFEQLDITLDYYTMRADDNYDMGSYLVGTLPNRKPARNAPVYAQKQDFLKSDVDTFTARINYAFNDNIRVSNLSRYGETDNGYVVTGGGAASTGANNPGGVFQTVTLGTHQGWQEVEYFANQTNLYIDSELFGRKNEFIVGVEYSDHGVVNGVYGVTNSGQNCITGNGTALNAWCVVDSSGNTINGINTIMNRQISKGAWDQDWSVKTISAYVMDTIDLTDQLSVFAGLRFDKTDFELKTQNTTTLAQTGDYDYSEDLYDGHLGVVYDINEYGNVYLSYGTATDINGGESDVGTNSGYGGLIILNGDVAGADPEKSELYELGTKWNLFDDRLLVTAALFQIDKSDVMEGNGYTSTGSFNSAENRVRGLEISATGEIMDDLTVQAGATFMDAEVLKSATPARVGKTLSNFADNSAFVQLKYEINEGFYVGGAVKYEDEKFAGQPDTAPGLTADGQYSQPIPSYTVLDLFASYRFNKQLDMRLNIGNVTDKDYYLAAYQSGRFLYIGDARNYRLTLNYDF